jgi:hypothetical protein
MFATTVRALARGTYIATLVILAFPNVNVELAIGRFILVQFLSMLRGFAAGVMFAFIFGHGRLLVT